MANEIEPVMSRGGVVRDLPSEVECQHELARALLDAGRRLAAKAFEEAGAFLEKNCSDKDHPDPFHNVALCAQERFGELMDLAEDAKRVPEIAGVSRYEALVRDFVAEQTARQQG